MNLAQALVAQNSRSDEERAIALVREQLAARDLYKIGKYFHDCLPGCKPASLKRSDHVPLPGNTLPTCRLLYIKHLAFMRAGLTYQERLFLAANRIGKTDAASYEIACHLSGRYPPWWQGRRFNRPTRWWAAGDTRQTTRDVVQTALLGRHEGIPTQEYSGMIEPRLIVNVIRASGGVANCVDTIYVEHINKGPNGEPMLSELGFKSYDQGRRTFQGTEKDGIWMDEEPPAPQELSESQAQGSSEVYTECLLRLLTTKGLLISTFTPLKGYTPFLRAYTESAMMPGTEGVDVDAKTHFFPGQLGQSDPAAAVDGQTAAAPLPPSSRLLIGADWSDAPHIDITEQNKLLASIPAYQRDARSKGIPQLGAGAIYPIAESDLRVPDMPIPAHWKRGYGMDVGGGAKPTAAVFGALDPDTQVLYITSVYKNPGNEPSLHAAAIKTRMDGWQWAGVGDAAALILTEHDSEQLVFVYRRLGLDINLPDKSVETGIKEVWDLMVLGRFKVFASCTAWFEEFRMYRRDQHGRIVKANDHVLDASRYLVRSGRSRMKVKPLKEEKARVLYVDQGEFGLGWMNT